MNILILVKTLTFGGAERVASLWANGFANHGHNVCVCTCRRDNVPDTYQVNKNIKRFNIYSWLLPKFSRIGIHPMAKKLKPIIDKVDPDVIICVQGHWAEWAYKATRSSRIPIINTEHNSFERPIYAPMPRKIWRAKFIENKRYSAVTVLTEADSRCIGNRLNNVFVLPNPLTYSPLTDIPPKEKIILAAGRFDVWHYKGFDLLIKAWGMIAPKNKEWTLYIAGTGTPKSIGVMQQFAKENNVENRIVFTGFVDMLSLYQKSSIFVLSSRYEGFGMVLTEAMSQGCACIACDYNGRQSEIITSMEEGITIPVDDADALASAINKLTNNDDLRQKLQQGALVRSHFYAIDHTINRWNEILSHIVK